MTDTLIKQVNIKLLGLAKNCTRDTELAKDIVQETWVEIFANKLSFQTREDFCYLFGILRNKYRLHCRENIRVISTDDLPDMPLNPVEHLHDTIDLALIRNFLATSKDGWVAEELIFRHNEALKLAQRKKIKLKTLYKKKQRIVDRLKSRFSEYLPESKNR